MPKMNGFIHESHWGGPRPTMTLLNVLSVMGVLNVLNVLDMLNVLNMIKDASLAYSAVSFLI